jgi:hypothetical protein
MESTISAEVYTRRPYSRVPCLIELTASETEITFVNMLKNHWCPLTRLHGDSTVGSHIVHCKSDQPKYKVPWALPYFSSTTDFSTGSNPLFVAPSVKYEDFYRQCSDWLRVGWDENSSLYSLLTSIPVDCTEGNFNSLKKWVKSKCPTASINSYAELRDVYNLRRWLKPEDFIPYEAELITHVLQGRTVFMSTMLDDLLSPEGYILYEGFWPACDMYLASNGITRYHCRVHKNKTLTWYPRITIYRYSTPPVIVDLWDQFLLMSRCISGNTSKLCFTTSIEKIDQLLQSGDWYIDMDGINVTTSSVKHVTSLTHDYTPECSWPTIPSPLYRVKYSKVYNMPKKTLCELLQQCGLSHTGTKKELAARLCPVVIDYYHKLEPYFNKACRSKKYIRFSKCATSAPLTLAVGIDDAVGVSVVPTLVELAQAAYILRHLRGSTILDSDTKPIIDVASAVTAVFNKPQAELSDGSFYEISTAEVADK